MPQRNEVFRSRDELNDGPPSDSRILNITGPLSHFNPTSVYFENTQTDAFERLAETLRPVSPGNPHPYRVSFYWNSRNNRKGLHVLVVSTSYPAFKSLVPPETISMRLRVYHNIIRMATRFPYWDISYLTAIVFLVGSLLWLLDGALTYQSDYNLIPPSIVTNIPVVAFFGTNVFLVTNILQMIECINDRQKPCFGWQSGASEQSDPEKGPQLQPGDCYHHHANRDSQTRHDSFGSFTEKHTWRWFPSYSELLFHYSRDLGFLACLNQLTSTVIFFLGAIMRLPGIYTRLSSTQEYITVWTPKGLGCLGFIVSGLTFMVETQKKWWLPATNVLGWWVGVVSALGGVGFLISTIFGTIDDTSAEVQSAIALVWAPIAYIIVSILQW